MSWKPLGCNAAALSLALAAAGAVGAEPLFALHELPGKGRVKTVEFADLDGDGRTDLFEVGFMGVPPEQIRELRVRFQGPAGEISETPDWTQPVFEDAVTYDLANLDAGSETEILLLRRDRISVLSLAGRAPATRDLALTDMPLLTIWPDERGLDALDIARADFGSDLRLVVPLFGETAVLTAAGELLGRLAAGGRANYFVPRKSLPLLTDSEIEIYFDHPRVHAGDVDGDGRPDLVVSNRHEVRVFPQLPDGSFASSPSQTLALGLLPEIDHVQYSGSVRTDFGNFDGDGRIDAIVSRTGGGLFNARSETRLFRNRSGRWDFGAPDQVIAVDGMVTRNLLLDLDGDGVEELIQARIPLGVLESVEVLLTRAIDANVRIHAINGDGVFDPEPFFEKKLDLAVDLQRQTIRGFIPTLNADLNGDGVRDLLDSVGGRALGVYLGGGDTPYREHRVQRDVAAGGRIQFGDLNGDELTDFVIFDPRESDAPILLGINLGTLPGTPPARARMTGSAQ